MKMNVLDRPEGERLAAQHGTEIKLRWLNLVFVLIAAAFSVTGCEGYYSAYPGYGPYYGGYGGYGRPAYYGYGYPGSVTIAVGDRPYYVRGPGYWYGGAYYGWRSGHWGWHHGQRVWTHGRYVVRRY